MSDTKHTPGPWRSDCFAVKGPDGNLIFHTGFGLLPPQRSGEAEANARLIAAAPDLLAACEAALAAIDEQRRSDDAIPAPQWATEPTLRAAIARATGRKP